jgi:hypothetical protein
MGLYNLAHVLIVTLARLNSVGALLRIRARITCPIS